MYIKIKFIVFFNVHFYICANRHRLRQHRKRCDSDYLLPLLLAYIGSNLKGYNYSSIINRYRSVVLSAILHAILALVGCFCGKPRASCASRVALHAAHARFQRRDRWPFIPIYIKFRFTYDIKISVRQKTGQGRGRPACYKVPWPLHNLGKSHLISTLSCKLV